MSREDALNELESEFRELLSAVDGLSDEAMTRVWFGDWGVRDILGHVAGWHREMTPVLERIARGERPVPEGVDYNDADTWNAKFAGRHKDTAPAAMLEELVASKEAFLAAARQVPEERFEERRAAHRIVLTTGTNHYREHAPEIRAWRQKEGV
jgi:hypothetical protein